MREIDGEIISKNISQAVQNANFSLDLKLLNMLEDAVKKEQSLLGKNILKSLIKNAQIAEQEKIAICQDTGIVVIFIKIGNQIQIQGDLYKAVNRGIKVGYNKGYLRKSVVKDPFNRENTQDNTPAIIYIENVLGDSLEFNILIKGAGSENMSRINMFNPTASKDEIIDFIIDTVQRAGASACPPYIMGIGIGGTFEKAALLSKKALLKEKTEDPSIRIFEKRILKEINKTGIGPGGLGGKVTALDVRILKHSCHIASLPVAVNINCHASRHIKISI